MTLYSILCKSLISDVFYTRPFKKSLIPDCLGDRSIDLTQPKEWCVSIPLRMQRALHFLGGNTVRRGQAERPYATKIRRRRPQGSCVGDHLLVKLPISFCADCG